ncbi:MAG: undecaprenyl/decaprenyl-phosphate alpha-N-acetylglucosaminyl 1-phosphate transferase [Planctomycetes bacterium]|nr:undecaprenyl/decaprenyl-phosphate alpha-N-acetylglucosaminyl 1-phosphate transferase [Planctomycetota bacterium]
MVEFGLVAFGAAMAVSALLTPIARRVAQMVDLVAEVRPDRLHAAPRPYGGGIAMADTLLLVVGGAWLVGLYAPLDWLPGWLPEAVRPHLEARTPVLLRLAFGGLVFFIIGMLDDRYRLPALGKFLLQAMAATLVVVGFGLSASLWIETPWLGQVVSILWVLAVVNAFNMFDHADGMAASVGVVAFGSLAFGQMMMGELFVPGMALAAAGALGGFLIYNFPPAKLFMGDAGSHLMGYLYAALAMVARYYFPDRGTTRWVVLVPVLIFSVPLLDMALVLLARVMRGRNPFVGDATSHLAHRMLARGARPWTPVLAAGGLTVFAGVGAVLLYLAPCIVYLYAAVAMGVVLWMRRSPEQEAHA